MSRYSALRAAAVCCSTHLGGVTSAGLGGDVSTSIEGVFYAGICYFALSESAGNTYCGLLDNFGRLCFVRGPESF